MISRLMLANISMGVAGLMLAALGLMLSFACRPVERWTRSFFIANFTVLVIYCVALLVDLYATVHRDASLLRPSIFAHSLTSSLLLPMLTVYMLKLCGEERRVSPLYIATLSLWGAYLLLLVYTQFSTVIYSVGADGIYRRGPLYPLLLVPPAAIMVLNLAGLWRRRAKLFGRQRLAMLIYLAVPLAAMLIQMFFFGLNMVAIGSILGSLAMFLFILSEQLDLAVRRAEEDSRKDFSLKVLQMRPHFIYNAMTSIYYLMDTDREKAKAALLDFSKYLHQNFNAVVKTEQIPFEEELRHTKAYLAVEQARFGERLEVTFDTPHTVFHLPPLTLEPIVENAVKHGMDPECDPLRIVIRTRATEDGSALSVENNGADFIPENPDGSQVGLNSVRERLKHMCGGTLTILPRQGGGTVVHLWIPWGDGDRGNSSRPSA